MGRLYVKNAGDWFQPLQIWVKNGGAWEALKAMWIKDQGVWKQVWPETKEVRIFTSPGVNTFVVPDGVRRIKVEGCLLYTSDAADE